MCSTFMTLLAFWGIVRPATAQEAATADRSQYTLFNPTPDRLLREMSTDRPDITEAPFTVDAGHVQLETTLLGYARSARDDEGATTDSYELGTTNVRIGLTDSTEAGFIWQPYGVVRTHGGRASESWQSGIGGLELRGKINIWGNNAYEKPGSTALALMPYVILPTDRHHGVSPEFRESGLIVPFAVKLSDKFALALNGGISRNRTDAGSGTHTEYIATASLEYEWTGKVSTYYEVAGRFHTEDERGDEVVVLGTGITYRWSKDVQFDAGINIGATPAADRINPFVGLSVRY
ncbi:MAG TPA: transporter [Hyphomicrobiaceae bacterium]|nr:transporter [Hyphomicrobiaceae bacterium]